MYLLVNLLSFQNKIIRHAESRTYGPLKGQEAGAETALEDTQPGSQNQ